MEDQLKGPSSKDGYIRALQKGCRCVECKFCSCSFSFLSACCSFSSFHSPCCCCFSFCPHSRELWTQKLRSHLVRIQSLNVLPLKPGVGQYIAIHVMLAATDFFLAYFYPSGPFTCIFSQTSPNLSCVGCG